MADAPAPRSRRTRCRGRRPPTGTLIARPAVAAAHAAIKPSLLPSLRFGTSAALLSLSLPLSHRGWEKPSPPSRWSLPLLPSFPPPLFLPPFFPLPLPLSSIFLGVRHKVAAGLKPPASPFLHHVHKVAAGLKPPASPFLHHVLLLLSLSYLRFPSSTSRSLSTSSSPSSTSRSLRRSHRPPPSLSFSFPPLPFPRACFTPTLLLSLR